MDVSRKQAAKLDISTGHTPETKLRRALSRLLPGEALTDVDEDMQRLKSVFNNLTRYRKRFSRKKTATGYTITRVK